MRASAIIEKTGIPTASLICDGFIDQAAAITPGLGIASLPVARIVGHVDGQNLDELEQNLRTVTSSAVIDCLTNPIEPVLAASEYTNDSIVAQGSFDDVNKMFYERH